jgi:hypothetical protein
MATQRVKTLADKWFIGSYRHLQPFPRGNLYYSVRAHLNRSQRQIAALFGVSIHAWRYRERSKRMYHPAEIVALQQLSGLDPNAFIELLKEIA